MRRSGSGPSWISPHHYHRSAERCSRSVREVASKSECWAGRLRMPAAWHRVQTGSRRPCAQVLCITRPRSVDGRVPAVDDKQRVKIRLNHIVWSSCAAVGGRVEMATRHPPGWRAGREPRPSAGGDPHQGRSVTGSAGRTDRPEAGDVTLPSATWGPSDSYSEGLYPFQPLEVTAESAGDRNRIKQGRPPRRRVHRRGGLAVLPTTGG
jgi:hypothetical protein